MKARPIFLLIFVLFVNLLFPASGHSASNPLIEIGLGKTDITPRAGVPLAGFGRRRGRPSSKIKDFIYCRAIAIRYGGRRFIFASADLVLIDAELRDEVLRKVQSQISIEPQDLILAATHNHSAPGAIGGRFWERFIMGKFQRKTFDKITGGIAEAIVDAEQDLRPSEAIEYAEVDISSLVENRMDPKIWVPQTMKVLRFKKEVEGRKSKVESNTSNSPSTFDFQLSTAESRPVAAHLIFMAAHPTLTSERYAMSADFPGKLNEHLEEKYPDSLSVFINGAAGDLRPHTAEAQKSEDRAAAYGLALAKAAESADYKSLTLEGPAESVLRTVTLPNTRLRAGAFRMPAFLGNRFFPRKTAFQGIRMGQLLFLTVPGELSSEIGYEIELRAKIYAFVPFLAGYANDYIGYVIPRRYYNDRSQYESRASLYGGGLDWFLQRQMDRTIEALLTEEELAASVAPGIRRDQGDLPVVELSGNFYHQGYEEGRLLRDEIQKETDRIYRYLRSELPVPFFNRTIIAAVLNRAWKKMEPYVSYNEYAMMRGIADGSRVPLKKIRQMHALPEVYPTWCSNGAYWGPATKDGRLIAIRNLDWNRKIGIHKFAAVKFHHGTSPHPTPLPGGEGIGEGEKSYVNIGYAGFSGVLSGINENGISIGQIGSTSADETMQGVPMPFLLRRILSRSSNLADVKKIFESSKLTRGYNYIIADAPHKEALAVEATAHHLAFFSAQDPAEQSVPYAISIQNAVIRSDTALNPEIRDLQKCSKGNPKKPGLEPPGGSAHEIRYKKHAELVKANYGKIDVEIAKKIALEIAPGSNIQSVIYAFPEFWVANAREEQKAAESKYEQFEWSEFEKSAVGGKQSAEKNG